MTVNELIGVLQGMVYAYDKQVTVYEPEGDMWDQVALVRSADNGNEVQLIGKIALELEQS